MVVLRRMMAGMAGMAAAVVNKLELGVGNAWLVFEWILRVVCGIGVFFSVLCPCFFLMSRKLE